MSTPTTSPTGMNDYELEPVPFAERRGWLPIALVWFAIGIDISGLLLGAELGAGLDFGSAVSAILIGSIFLGILGAACSYVGASANVATPMIARATFGVAGAKVVSLLIALSMVGWFGVQAGFFAVNVSTIVQQLSGVAIPVSVLAFAGGLLMMTTAFAFKLMSRLSTWSVPLLAVLILLTLILGFAKFGSAVDAAPLAPGTFTFGSGVSFVIGIYVLGVVMSPDIARWAISRRDAMIAAFVGFFVGNSFMLIIAVVLEKIMGTKEVIGVFMAVGLGIPAIVILTLAQWTTNTSNLYSASLGFANLLPKARRTLLTLVVGVAASALAFFGIFDKFTTFLSMMSALITPIGGAYLAEYFVVDKAKFSAAHQVETKLFLRSAISWASGCAISFLTDPTLGAGMFTVTTVPAMDGFVIAFCAQTLGGLLVRRRAGREGADASR